MARRVLMQEASGRLVRVKLDVRGFFGSRVMNVEAARQ